MAQILTGSELSIQLSCLSVCLVVNYGTRCMCDVTNACLCVYVAHTPHQEQVPDYFMEAHAYCGCCETNNGTWYSHKVDRYICGVSEAFMVEVATSTIKVTSNVMRTTGPTIWEREVVAEGGKRGLPSIVSLRQWSTWLSC